MKVPKTIWRFARCSSCGHNRLRNTTSRKRESKMFCHLCNIRVLHKFGKDIYWENPKHLKGRDTNE